MKTVTETAPRPAVIRERHDPRDPYSRLETLFGENGLRVITPYDGSGVVSASGSVDGVPSVAFASDPRVKGGAMGGTGCAVILRAYEHAMRDRIPIIGLWHSGGARLQEGVESLHAVGQVFAAMTSASGKIPQISVVLGPAAGGAAYGPALTDVVVMSAEGRIFVTGPDVVRSVTGEVIDMTGLGGPLPHTERSGVAHLAAPTEAEAVRQARLLVVLLGHPGDVRLDTVAERDLSALLPESPRRAYDVRPLVELLVDDMDRSVELSARWAPNIVTTLGRLGGRAVGVLANNPLHLAGCLDAVSGEKAARFVRMCDAFGLPLIVVVDVPGYLPGVAQEHSGVVRRGAKLLHAFAEASVPRVTLITRKAYGGAYIAMNSRSLGATKVFAWPTAEVAVMGAEAAVRILHRRALADVPEHDRCRVEAQLAAEHARTVGGVDQAKALGVVDEVITPRRTRKAIAQVIGEMPVVRGNHRNIPL
jgi:acetyl-CoA/propionyl-CoA carboxylase carboxyl transferase subunit